MIGVMMSRLDLGSLDSVIDAFRDQPRDVALAAELAQLLAATGTIRDADETANDLASTGGPASLSTFLAPLVMVHDGDIVPKVGVPGRPAGVIDTLGVIPGYSTDLGLSRFDHVLKTAGFANTLAADTFAPGDGVLFKRRQERMAQTIPGLVAASLISKKVAVGLRRVTIDVRVLPGGNFGETLAEAEDNIVLLRAVGEALGVAVTAVASDGASVPQPFLGRAEALGALVSIFDESADSWLHRHFIDCIQLARAHRSGVGAEGGPKPSDLAAILDQNLRAQGSRGIDDVRSYLARVDRVSARVVVRAPRDGQVHWDPAMLRSAIVGRQDSPTSALPGDGCGLRLLAEEGAMVSQGDELAVFRIGGSDDASLVVRNFAELAVSSR
jgi:pyrimidine-nucleoside phosphorylase